MIPDFIHPILQKTVRSLLTEVFDPSVIPMNKVIPFPRLPLQSWDGPFSKKIEPVPSTLTHWTYASDIPSRKKMKGMVHTNVMATLNVTPDSFSDGSLHNTLPASIAYVQESVAAGATIVDIGGYSSRPGSSFVSTEEELSRVLPAVQALRNPEMLRQYEEQQHTSGLFSSSPPPPPDITKRVLDTPLSVDTYRWEVAEAALQAGANCINDIYAFTGPNYPPEEKEAKKYMTEMTAVARRYASPVVLMHSRGDAKLNKDYSNYAYVGNGENDDDDGGGGGMFVEGVRVELGAKVEKVIKEGVRRWLVIADPGIGFSKPLQGNLEILREAVKIVENVLIGDGKVIVNIISFQILTFPFPSPLYLKEHKYRNPLAGFPLLIGVSKKSFLGYVLASGPNARQTQAKDRTWATAAAVSTSVQQNPLIVRVHDVREMMDVVNVTDAIWF